MADVTDLNPDFKSRLDALIAASHGMIYITSGYRSDAQQQQLYDAAVKKYGSPEAASKWVAAPGHSNHNRGLAADLGGDMSLAHQLAPQFGLYFPMSWENWHIEPVSTADPNSPGHDPAAYSTSPFGDVNPTVQDRSNDPAYWAASVVNALSSTTEDPLGVGSSTDQLTSGSVDFSKGANAGTTGPTGTSGTAGEISGGGQSGRWNIVQWAHDFLSAGGFPTTDSNMKAIEAWARAEGGIANNNPLNTTQGGYAGHPINSVGVMNYNSYDDSIRANLQALNNGRYGPVISALQAGNDPMAVANAVGSSPWGTSGKLMSQILAGG